MKKNKESVQENENINKRAPTMFVGHGSPMNSIANNIYTQSLFQIGENLKNKINAILCISAHWQTEGIYVSASQNQKIIYDFSGFPDELYKVKYPAPGSEDLAKKVTILLSDQNAKLDYIRGLDHGCWCVLKHMFPKADIPTVQLSLNLNFRTKDHYSVASQLKSLREEGILILGSGNIVHSFYSFNPNENADPPEWGIEFDSKIKLALINNDHDSIIQYRKIFGKIAKLSVPTDEHYLPILYTIALQQEEEKVQFIYEGFQNSSFSMRSLIIV